MLDDWLNATGRWSEAGELLAPLAKPLPLEKGEPEGSLGCAMHAPGGAEARPPWGLVAGVLQAEIRARAAMMAGDEAGVSRALEPALALQAAMAPWGKVAMYRSIQARSEKLAPALSAGARAHKSHGAADRSAAVEAFQKLAAATELLVNGPAFFPPSQQLLGEVLLAAGQPTAGAQVVPRRSRTTSGGAGRGSTRCLLTDRPRRMMGRACGVPPLQLA